MSYKQELIEFDCEWLKETNQAWYLLIETIEVWLPKSQCTISQDKETILIPIWLAIEKGLV